MKFKTAIFIAILLHFVLMIILLENHDFKERKKPLNIVRVKIGENIHKKTIRKQQKATQYVAHKMLQSDHNIAAKKQDIAKITKKPIPPKKEIKAKIIPVKKPAFKKQQAPQRSLAQEVLNLPQQIFKEAGVDVDLIKNQEIKEPVKKKTAIIKKAPSKVKGSKLGNEKHALQLVIRSYNEKLSLWIGQHKKYPKLAKNITGNAIIVIKVDKYGNVLAYELEKKTGFAILDDSIIEMIERANPVPPFPLNYPDIEYDYFRIPIHISP